MPARLRLLTFALLAGCGIATAVAFRHLTARGKSPSARLTATPQPSPSVAARPASPALLPTPPASPSGPVAPSSEPLAAFARWLDAHRRGAAPDPTTGLALARARRAALKTLVAAEPRAALAVAVPPSDRTTLPAPIAAELETLLDTTGRLTVGIACFGPRHDHVIRWVDVGPRRYLAFPVTPSGLTLSSAAIPVRGLAVDDHLALADVAAPPHADAEAVSSPGRSAAAPGPAPTDPIVASADAAPRPRAAAVPAAWVFGEKTVLWVRADFADDPGAPATDADIARLMEDANRFFAENSAGRTTLRPVVLPATVRVSATKAALAAGTVTFSAVETEALRLARAAFAAAGTSPNPVDTADRTVVVTRSVSALGFGGFATVGGRGVYLNGNLDSGVFTHELGHNHGLPHAHGWRPATAVPTAAGAHVDYGDPFDLMGLVSSPPLGHWGAKPKHDLGYLDVAAVQTVAASGTYRIFRHDHPDADGVRALRLAAGPVDVWLEHRRLAPGNWFRETARLAAGLQVRWSRPPAGTGDGTALLDTRPLTAADFEDAPVAVGETFTDPSEGLSFTPLAVGGSAPREWIDVRIDFGAPPGSANRNPVLVSVSPAASAAASARTAVTFTASASDPDGDAVTVRWDFGDGSARQTGPAVTHRFAAAGTYRIVCSVVDGRGGLATRPLDLVVDDPLSRWTAAAALPGAEAPFALAHDGRRWLAAGAAVHASADGATWTRLAALPDHTTAALLVADGRAVAVGRRTSAPGFGSIVRSVDGETWQTATPAAVPPALAAVAFHDGRWVAVGAGGLILASPDAAAWTPVPSRTVAALRDVRYAAGLFVAVGADGIVASADGLVWETRAAGPAYAFDRVAFHDGRWIAARAGTVAVAAPDAAAWTLAPAAELTATAALLSLDSTHLLALGAARTVHASADAARWSAYSVSGDATAGDLGAAAAHLGTVLVATTSGRIFRASLSASAVTPPVAAPVLAAQFAPPGATVAFDAGPAQPGVAYQWFKDAAPLPGATAAVLAFAAVAPADAGRYHVVLAHAAGTVASAPAELRVAAATARLANLSVRTRLAPADDLTIGFVVAPSGYTAPGPALKNLLLRAAGPALAAFGVAPALADPRLELFAGPALVAANDDWSTPAVTAPTLAAAFAAAGAFAFPAASRDAALLAAVAPAARTVRLSAPAADTGEVLAELYDLDASDLAPRLANLSARGRVDGTARPLIGGFVLRGTGTRRLLVRAVGPGLAAFGVADPLAAPVLTLVRDGTVLAANTGWTTTAAAADVRALAPAVGAFALAEDSRDSAFAPALAAGAYTVVVTASAAVSGSVLLEIYEVP